jgi:hypothetical protein
MIRTGIPISTWESEGDAVIETAYRLLFEQDHDVNLDLVDMQSMREMGLI